MVNKAQHPISHFYADLHAFSNIREITNLDRNDSALTPTPLPNGLSALAEGQKGSFSPSTSRKAAFGRGGLRG